MEIFIPTAHVLVPCHFTKKDQLCKTTFVRINSALKKAAELSPTSNFQEAQWAVTGHVPYAHGSLTLAELQKKSLMEKGIPEKNIIIIEGVGIFSESANTPVQIKSKWPDTKRLFIHSSDWYFWAGGILWKMRGQECGMHVIINKVQKTGGIKTKAMYAVYGTVVHISLFLGCGDLVENKLTQMQSSRKEGFTMDGCK